MIVQSYTRNGSFLNIYAPHERALLIERAVQAIGPLGMADPAAMRNQIDV
jgi:hypothetical protein